MYSDQDVPQSNQSLRILSNLVAAGAFNSSGRIDELIKELLVFTRSVIAIKSSEVIDMMAKVHHNDIYYSIFSSMTSKTCLDFSLMYVRIFQSVSIS